MTRHQNAMRSLPQFLARRGWVTILVCVGVSLGRCLLLSEEPPKESTNPPSAEPSSEAREKTEQVKPQENREVFSGKVVFLQDALKRRGIKSRDEIKQQVVLETSTGEIWPIIPDWRGRAFFQDESLRNRQVDLVCRRSPGLPYLQVLSVYTFDEKGTRQYTDYWCDICSIPMYEIKDCDCCRGPIRLRFQPQKLPEYARPYEPQRDQKQHSP